jgi:tetratricopeptide (TPR) repeat protein
VNKCAETGGALFRFFRFVCVDLLVFLVPLGALAQSSSIESSGVPAPTQENRSTVALQASSELSGLRDCLARADRKCAVEAFSQLQNYKFKGDPQYLELSAQVLSLEHNEAGALAAIDRAIQMDPKQASYLVTRGRIFQKSHDQLHAIESFLQAAQLRPGWIEPVYSLGMSFFILGNEEDDNEYYDRAARHFNAALALEPNSHKTEFMLGVVEAIQDHLEKGKAHFENALKMDPQNAYYHLEYGILLDRLGDDNGGLREMKLAEALDHSNPLIHFNIGRLEARRGNYAEARKQLETAVQLDSNLSVAYYSLGGVYHHLGLTELSQAAYKEFQFAKARGRQEEPDPVEAALSRSDRDARDMAPK